MMGYRLAVVLVAIAWIAAPAGAITGREVIDTAQQRNGFSTWRDRAASASMQTYDKGSLVRTRELRLAKQPKNARDAEKQHRHTQQHCANRQRHQPRKHVGESRRVPRDPQAGGQQKAVRRTVDLVAHNRQ